VTVRRTVLAGRVLGGLVALVGLGTAVLGLTMPPYFVLGSQPVAVGPLTAADLLGLGGAVAAVGALPVVAGRGRNVAVSLAGVVLAGGVGLVVAVPPDTVPYVLWLVALGLGLLAAASLGAAPAD
jgi:hypothetical protein